MTGKISVDVASRLLTDALKQPNLPKKTQKVGKRLLDRLSAPVRITLLGPATTGKRLIVNALAGRSVMPQSQRMPTFEVCRGDERKLHVTLRSGQGKDLQGHDFAALPDFSPSFVQVFTDDAYFRNVTLLAIKTDGSAEQELSAANWAAKRTDIAIWVTHEFSPKQQTLWSRMPESLHDHCFLVPISRPSSRIDVQSGSHIPQLGSVLFLGVYPLIEDAEGAFDAKGIEALREELKRCVEFGLQEDLDQALLFLDERAGEQTPDPDKDDIIPADENAGDGAPSFDLLSLGAFGDDDLRDKEGEFQGQGHAALNLVTTEATDMLGLLDTDDAAATAALTGRCSEAAQKLCDLIAVDDPLYDTVSRTAEYLVLLDLEDNEDSPENAVTALLQMKRAIEVELAA